MADQTARGDEFEKKAEKKLNGWSFFGSKTDEAADLYEKAANCFKLAKNLLDSLMRTTYVVFVGRRPGLYYDWHECNQQVRFYKGALHQKFQSYEEAERAFMNFWGIADDGIHVTANAPTVLGHNVASSTVAQLSPNEGLNREDGGTSTDNQISLINLLYLLAIVCLILSLKVLIG